MKRNLIISSFLTLGLFACGGEETPNDNNNKQGDTTSDVVVKSCEPGTFGPNCLPVTCVNGTANDGKDGDGKCASCNKGWSGDNCDKCAEEFTGENCNSCAEGYTGENCQQCVDGFAGTLNASDGNTYKTICINKQNWMAENLRNDSVNHLSPDGNSSNDAKYGYLYNFVDALKACPTGWRLPTKEEFNSLITATESADNSSSLRDNSWDSGSNSYEFSALPAGLYDFNFNEYQWFSTEAFFWSSTKAISNYGYVMILDSSNATVSNTAYHVGKALSVRCLKETCTKGYTGSGCVKITCNTEHGILDSETGKCFQCHTGFYGDNCTETYDSINASDGNTYKTIKIGGLTWMAENLRNHNIDHYSVNDDYRNDQTLGLLYSWENALKACPTGWRLPTKEEFQTLVNSAPKDGEFASSVTLRDTSWEYGTNSTGFSALEAGIWFNDDSHSQSDAYFWSSTAKEDNSDRAYNLYLSSNNSLYLNGNDKQDAISVRCVLE